MKTIFLSASLLFISMTVHSQFPDLNISNSPFWDTEPFLISNPYNSSAVCAWMSTGQGLVTIKTKTSLYPGSVWGNTHTFPHHYLNATSADVSMQYDGFGVLYLCFIDYKTTFDSGAVYFYKSPDDGITWDNGVKAFDLNETADGAIDRPWFDMDHSATSNNIYLVTKSPEAVVVTNKHLWLKKSGDGGATFSAPIQIDDTTYPAAGDKTMGTPCVDWQGNLFITYLSYEAGSFQYPKLVCAQSTDQGNSFTYSEITTFTSANPDSTLQFDWAMKAAQSIPVVVYTSSNNGDMDIMSQRFVSNAWSAPIRLNTDPIGNGIQQDMVWITKLNCLSFNGTEFMVAWRDRRNFGTAQSAPFEIYGATSSDFGQTFYQDQKISVGSSPFQMLIKGNDFLGVTFNVQWIFAAWGDYRDGNWEIYINRIPNPFYIHVPEISSDCEPVIKIFNQQLVIDNVCGFSNVVIQNVLGQTLVDQKIEQQEKPYQLWLRAPTTSGLYFITFSSEKNSLTQKFLVGNPE